MYRDYILTVDRGNPCPHGTSGRYRVCAKSEKQAKSLLQEQIGFGKIQILKREDQATLSRKTAVRELGVRGTSGYRQVPVRHENEPVPDLEE